MTVRTVTLPDAATVEVLAHIRRVGGTAKDSAYLSVLQVLNPIDFPGAGGITP